MLMGLGALSIGQLLALTVAYASRGTSQAAALGVASAFSVLVMVLAAGLYWRDRKQHAHADNQALARWLNQIDVAADCLPATHDTIAAHTPVLTASVEALVSRVHDYREKLLSRHQRMQRLLRNVSDMLYHADRDGRLIWVSESASDMLGYSPDELRDTPLARLLVDPDTDLPLLRDSARLIRHPTRVFRRDGRLAWLLISSRRIDDPQGQPVGSEGICRDGTRLIETEHQLNQEKERAQVTLAAISDGVITTDAEGRIDYVNPGGQHMLGRDSAQMQGMDFERACKLFDPGNQQFVTGLISECLRSGDCREWAKALDLVEVGTASACLGRYRSVTVTVSPIRNEQRQIIGVVVVLHDVTRLERISRELTYQANHDPLTGLLNRRAFERQLRNMLEMAHHDNTQHTLCYFDLDQFKLVNDSCGHHAGDAMLRQLSSQMAAQLRPDDTLARLGGDEFGIIFQGTELEVAHLAAERLRQWLEGFCFSWENKTFRVRASIGLSLIDHRTISATEALRCADTACYLAKEGGRNQIRSYHRDSDEARLQDDEIENMQKINKALDNNGFTLHAQPIRPLTPGADSSRIGIEFLLRMTDDPGYLSPQRILLTAEHYSTVSRIDRWVIEHALRLISRHDVDSSQIGFYSINISGQSITDELFIGFVRECIERSGINPASLVFEITETAAVSNLQRAAELMRSLRLLGCRFALDDFGSGVSSFDYLKHLPSDFVKIDGSLVAQITDDPIEKAIVEAINNVSRALDLQTVAEHVETGEQLEALTQMGINHVQGHYIGRPMPFDELLHQLEPTA